jgi:hypothetical protein
MSGKKLLLALVACCVLLSASAQVSINPLFFGQNYWHPNNLTSTHANWTKVQNSGVKIMRLGGIEPNLGDATVSQPPVTIDQMLSMIDYARQRDIEPVIQVPLCPSEVLTSHPYAQPYAHWLYNARKMVYEINVVHKKNIKYWIIANEPDQPTTVPWGYSYDTAPEAVEIAKYIREFSAAMKDADPTIKIIGPELSWAKPAVYDELLSNPSTNAASILGTIPTGAGTGLYYVDIVSYHLYPSYTSMDEVIEFPSQKFVNGDPGFYGLTDFFNNSTTNAPSRNINNLKIAITELDHTGSASESGTGVVHHEIVSQNNTFTGFSANGNSFVAGQWWIDIMANMLNSQSGGKCIADFLTFWSVQEGNTHGYLHSANNEEKSKYWHFQMMANNFRGNFHMATVDLCPQVTGNNIKKVKAFGSQDDNQISVIIMNQSSTDQTFQMNFNNSNVYSSGLDVNLRFNFNKNKSFTFGVGGNNPLFKVEANSTMLMTFNCSGDIVSMKKYKQADAVNAAIASTPDPGPQTPSGFSPVGTMGALPTLAVTDGTCLGGLYDGDIVVNSCTGCSYAWSNFNTGSSITNVKPGAYFVDIIKPGGCNTPAIPIRLTGMVDSPEMPSLDVTPLTSAHCGTSGPTLTATTSNPAGINWTATGGTLGCTTCLTPTATTSSTSTPGSYTATVTQTGMCSNTKTVTVKKLSTAETHDVYVGDGLLIGGNPDNPQDVGNEANNTSGLSCSDDIWVRNYSAVLITDPTAGVTHYKDEHIHQSPDWTNIADNTPWVYVKLRNIGCQTVTGTLYTFWDRGGSGGSDTWKQVSGNNHCDWTNIPPGPSYTAGSGVSVSVPAGQTHVTRVQWRDIASEPVPGSSMTNPSNDYCLTARFASANDPMISELQPATCPGTSFQYNNILQNNNWAQKNVVMVNNITQVWHSMTVGNSQPTPSKIKLKFAVPVAEYSNPLTDYGDIAIYLGSDLLERWVRGGSRGAGIEVLNDSVILVTDTVAFIENIEFAGNEELNTSVTFLQTSEPASYGTFNWSVTSYATNSNRTYTQGHQYYIVNLQECAAVFAGFDQVIGASCSTSLTATPAISDATYTWYEAGVGSISTDRVTVVSPTVTTTYYVEMTNGDGCDVKTDTVIVSVDSEIHCRMGHDTGNSSQGLMSIVPNPASDKATIYYSIGTEGEIRVTNVFGQTVAAYKVNAGTGQVNVDCAHLASGIYYTSLVAHGKIEKTMKLVITK